MATTATGYTMNTGMAASKENTAFISMAVDSTMTVTNAKVTGTASHLHPSQENLLQKPHDSVRVRAHQRPLLLSTRSH